MQVTGAVREANGSRVARGRPGGNVLAASGNGDEGPARRRVWLRWLPLAALAALLVAAFASGLGDYLTIDQISRSRDRLASFVAAHPFGAAGLYCAVYIACVAVSIPGASALTVAGGLMFGALVGTVLAALSATIGAMIIFLAARSSLGETLAERAGPRLSRLRTGFQADAFNYLLFLRLVPAFPFWLINLAAALFGMRPGPYAAATAIGILPGTAVFAYFGSRLDSALAEEGLSLSPGLFVAFALLGALALAPALVRRWRGNRET